MKILGCLQIVFFLTLNKKTVGFEKQWIVDLEWQTQANWDRPPEMDGHVIFPLETRHVVGLPKNIDLRLSKIDLPREGSLVLFRDGKLELSESKNTNAKISSWSKEGNYFWADPNNWNGVSEAAPHMERVPCRQDDVVLPGTDRTYSIHLPVKDVQVRSIRLADHKYPSTWWDWKDMVRRKREFIGASYSVKYSQYSCDKCLCQDGSQYDYLEEICAIQRPKCDFAACEYPLKVEGHCCLYCGGRLTLPKGTSLAMIRSLVDEVFEQRSATLAWYVRRAWKGNIEVLLKEKADYTGVETLEALEDLKTKFLHEKLEVLYIESTGAPLSSSRLASILGPLFGAPLVILVLLIAVFLYFGYSMRHVLSELSEAWTSIRKGTRIEKPRKPFGFARFENIPEGNVNIDNSQRRIRRKEGEMTEELVTEEEEIEEESTSGGGKFENPLYRSKRSKDFKDFKSEERELIDVDLPLSLTALQKKVAENTEEDTEMHIEE
ncbi:hypothetical protein KPH14_008553 [Odynerus spinipes]|uniref:Protein amnionless n=1 Tax=Odynerus spinipes TaxID=1348599 RepID=A0AAD9RSH6_9HYME|nr:hypothetical protein KPH14_008553 [Odynerus spinipes]